MGYQLWTSPVTGYRRRGTRLSEFRALLERAVTADSILEPLQSCPAEADAVSMRGILEWRDFDVAGVMEVEDGPVVGWVEGAVLTAGRVRDHLRPISRDMTIPATSSVTEVLAALATRPFQFVSSDRVVRGIVAQTDLNKPPVRVFMFGLVSLLEMHLNFWVRQTYPGDTWAAILKVRRVEAARREQERQGQAGIHAELVDCLQFCDRRDLVLSDAGLCDRLELSNKRAVKRQLTRAEGLRNHLAHSQQNIAQGASWEELISLVNWVECFLEASDQLVERDAAAAAESSRGLWLAS